MPDFLQVAALWATHRWCFMPDFRGKWRVRAWLIRACRWLQGHGRPVPLRLRSGIVIEVDLEMGMPRWIITNDVGEKSTAAVLDQVLRRRDVVADVGANIGYFSLLCAVRVSADGRIFAFEPGATAWGQLTANIALNRMGAIIHPRQVAVGRQTARGRLRQSRPGAEDAAVLVDRSDSGGTYEEVAIVTLDEALRDLDRPLRLLKVDVEGREWDVLWGAESRLACDRPFLFVELSLPQQTRFGYHPRELVHWIEARGYSVATVERGLEAFEARHIEGVTYLNVLATPTAGPNARPGP